MGAQLSFDRRVNVFGIVSTRRWIRVSSSCWEPEGKSSGRTFRAASFSSSYLIGLLRLWATKCNVALPFLSLVSSAYRELYGRRIRSECPEIRRVCTTSTQSSTSKRLQFRCTATIVIVGRMLDQELERHLTENLRGG